MNVKKFVNEPSTCVEEMLNGIKAAFPGLHVDPKSKIVLYNKDRGNKVAVISGGGSGHEPFPCGYVADNMITGAVCGQVFTSPPSASILDAIITLSRLNRGGVLFVTLNYTGDVLNVGLAIEEARRRGIEVESIKITDDCALFGNELTEITGRRGILGCSLVFKILGGMSLAEKSLSELISAGQELQTRIGSMGVCLYSCTLPDSYQPLFNLDPNKISLGLGVHGEAGIATVKMCSLQSMVEQLLDYIFETKVIKEGDDACVLVGDLGICTQLKYLVITNEVKKQIEKRGVIIHRLFVGPLMTSLDMKGFQVSILNITGRKDWLKYIDEPTEAFGWPGTAYSSVKSETMDILPSSEVPLPLIHGLELSKSDSKIFKACILAACEQISENKSCINFLDSGCGDGDCGTTLCNFASGVLKELDNLPFTSMPNTFLSLSKIAEKTMGGTSGAVYSLLLQGAANHSKSWETAWKGAIETLYKYTTARINHRTMVLRSRSTICMTMEKKISEICRMNQKAYKKLDALIPAFETYIAEINKNSSWEKALKLAVKSAEEGSLKTKHMTANFTGYLVPENQLQPIYFGSDLRMGNGITASEKKKTSDKISLFL